MHGELTMIQSDVATHRGDLVAFFFPMLLLLAGLAIQAMGQLNHDVGFLAWGARKILHGAVIGKDLVEVNFPLAFMIYLPPALLSSVISFPFAIRLWVMLLAILAITLAWKDVPRQYRLVVFSTLAAYVALAWPREFAQREQLAMLLVFPYIVPGDRRGLRAVLIGVLAGVGFAMKPHFLLAWLAIEIGRKVARPEQLALVAFGIVYALALVVLTPEFTFGLLPVAMEMYAISDRPYVGGVAIIPLIVAVLALFFAIVAKNPLARAMALGGVGFSVAAILQFKYYNYHFVSTYGYSLVAIAVLLRATHGATRIFLGLVMAAVLAYLTPPVSSWWSDREGRMALAPHLLEQLQANDAETFIALGVHPYPAFPAAIYYEELGGRFVGVACCSSFLPAAASGNPIASSLAKSQLLGELRKQPDVILVDRDWRRHTNVPAGFDGLAWYLSDPAINSEWRNYAPYSEIGPYVFYRRRDVIGSAD